MSSLNYFVVLATPMTLYLAVVCYRAQVSRKVTVRLNTGEVL